MHRERYMHEVTWLDIVGFVGFVVIVAQWLLEDFMVGMEWISLHNYIQIVFII